MSCRFRPPTLSNPDIVIRLAVSPEEVEAANQLVYHNYINLYWPADEEAFRRNKYLNLPSRRVFVAVESGRVIGTMSIINDSSFGLPSDTFRPDILRRYRKAHARLAEVMSFAVDQSAPRSMAITLFLIKFLFQYSFFYADLDRLIASCRPKHADFYEERLCFEKLTKPAPYAYAGNVECQLVTLDLFEAHLLLSRRYETGNDSHSNFYRFLFVDDHPNVRLPGRYLLRRSRQLNWADRAQTHEMRVAV